MTAQEIEASLTASRTVLRERRATRPKPHRDDKIVTAWNGLMIAALAKASAVLSSEKYTDAAKSAATFIRENLWDAETKSLFRSYRGKRGEARAFPADYAFLIFGLIELNAADPTGGWQEWATELQASMDREAWDENKIGYVMSTKLDGKNLLTIREDYDGAEPAANHVAALNLQKLAVLCADTGLDNTVTTERSEGYQKRAEALIRAGATMLEKQVFAAPVLLSAYDLHDRGVRHFQLPETDYTATLSRLTQAHEPRAVFNAHQGTNILLCENMMCKIYKE